MRQLVRVLTGLLAFVSVLSLGGAAGLTGPLVKDSVQRVSASSASLFADEQSTAQSGPIGISVASVSRVDDVALAPFADDVFSDSLGLPSGDEFGIPAMVLDAYRRAAQQTNAAQPSCGIRWQILAGIGKVESNHAGGGQLTASGVATPPILGPVLDGNGLASISDHDGGRWDGDAVWDRAVGPMQFIPGTWKAYGVDGSGDAIPDPHNVYDAALSAAQYLCAESADLTSDDGLTEALLRYNNSIAYVVTVVSWIAAYDDGRGAVVPDLGPGPGPGDPGWPDTDDSSDDDSDHDSPPQDNDRDKSPQPKPTKSEEPTKSPTPKPTLTVPPDPDPDPDPDPSAELTLAATVDNGDGGTALASDWELAASGPETTITGSSGTEAVTGKSVPPGQYALAWSGGPENGYTASAWSCDGGSLDGDTVTLADGDAVKCTIGFDDVPPPPPPPSAELTLVAVVVNDDEGSAAVADWVLSASGPQAVSGASGVTGSVAPGTYVLAASGPEGYTASAWSCAGGALAGDAVTLADGDQATCTITFDDEPPPSAVLTLAATVDNGDGGTALASDWELAASGPETTITGSSGTEAVTGKSVPPGQYALAWSGGPENGYAASPWSCDGGSLADDMLTLADGEDVTCTITFDDQPEPTDSPTGDDAPSPTGDPDEPMTSTTTRVTSPWRGRPRSVK